MRLWLRSTPEAVGLDCEVIPREALACVLELDAAGAQVHARCAQALADAQTRAQALLDAAQRQAEAANHHPDIAFGWGHASVAFTTHSAKGVTLNDLIMAARLNLALPD